MQFIVRGRKISTGQMVRGVVEAASSSAAAAQAAQSGVEVISVQAEESPRAGAQAPVAKPPQRTSVAGAGAPPAVAAALRSGDAPWRNGSMPPASNGRWQRLLGPALLLGGGSAVALALLIAAYFLIFSGPPGIDARRLLPDCSKADYVVVRNIDVARMMRSSMAADLKPGLEATLTNRGAFSFELSDVQDLTTALYQININGAGSTRELTIFRLKSDKALSAVLRNATGDKKEHGGVEYQESSANQFQRSFVAKLESRTFLICDNEEEIKAVIDRYQGGTRAEMPADWDDAAKRLNPGDSMTISYRRFADTGPHYIVSSGHAGDKYQLEGAYIFESPEKASTFLDDLQKHLTDEQRAMYSYSLHGSAIQYTATLSGGQFNRAVRVP